jgi:hypothetical protein
VKFLAAEREKNMADDDKTKSGGDTGKSGDATQNKAQVEFQKYMKRMQAQGGIPGFMMPGGEGAPGWAVPPSVAMLPRGGPGYFAPMSPAGGFGEGSLTHGLGSTLRLGVDVLNAALAGGVRFLNGMTGAAYGEQDHAGCGCGCGCGDSCSGSDCCGCECCEPGVGTCC